MSNRYHDDNVIELFPEKPMATEPSQPPHEWPQLPCSACPEAEAWVARTGVRWHCWGCSAELMPSGRTETMPRDAMADMENLARWTPEIEGSAIPMNPPLFFENKFASNTLGRRIVKHPNDLDGMTMHVAGRTPTRMDVGRPDRVDTRSGEFTRAIETLRILDVMVARGDGFHAAVLLYVGWWLGPAARAYWNGVDEDTLVYGKESMDRHHAWIAGEYDKLAANDNAVTVPAVVPGEPLGVDWRVGMVFQNDVPRIMWLNQGLLGKAVARLHGKTVTADAIKAYQAAATQPRTRDMPRVSLVTYRDGISAAVADADHDIDEALRPRAIDRRRQGVQRMRDLQPKAA